MAASAERPARRLAAILSADVVGYWRMMRADEKGALSRLIELRRTVVAPTVAENNGRIVRQGPRDLGMPEA